MDTAAGSIHVLHVDDEAAVAELAAEFLERKDEKFAVDTATSANNGLDRLADTDYDCIVSDYEMPRQDGIDFLEAVRERYPELPFILYTGKGSEEVASEAIAGGVTDYLQKEGGSSQYEVLANRIRNAVEGQRATERAEDTEKWASTLLEYSSDYVFVVDDAGDVSYASPSVTRVLGYDPDELTGTDAFDFVHPDDVETAADSFAKILDRENEDVTVEFRAEHADGSHRWLEVRGRNLLDDPVIDGLLVNARDITERKSRQRELKRHEAYLEQSRDIITVVDDDGTVQFQNASTEQTTEISPDQVMGQDAFEHVHPEDREKVSSLFTAFVAESKPEGTVELRVETADGSWRWVEARGVNKLDDPLVEGIIVSSRDITNRKQREQQLREEQVFNELALDSVLEFYWVLDTDGHVTDWSDEDGSVTGYPSEEAVGMHATELFPDDERDYIEQKVTELLETGSMTAEVDFQKKDGELVPYRFDGTVLTDDDGEVAALCGFGHDISDQVERERELREERDFVEQLINRIPDLFYVADVDGSLRRWNTRLLEVTGFTEAEIEEMAAVEFFAEDDREKVGEAIVETVTDGQAVVEGDFRTADGELIPYEFTGGRLTDSDGEVSGLVGIGRDISERKQREYALEQLQAATRDLLRAATSEEVATIGSEAATEVLELSMNGIHLYDAEADALVPVAWTNRSDDLLGGEPPALPVEDSVAGRVYRTGEAENYADVTQADGLFNPDTPFRSELYLPVGDHGVFIFSSTEREAFDAADKALAHMLAATVEAALDRVEQRQQLLRERDRLDEFASVVSHDLRNPLNLAEGRLELAREECNSEHLEDVAYGIDRSLSLIEDLLVLAQEGTSVGAMEAVDLEAVVERCWRSVGTADATVTVAEAGTIRADESRVIQLLENLLRNAIEHGGEDVLIEVGAQPGGFYVADDGPGIPEDDRDIVFDPGYSTSDEGNGLGLNIIREIAEAHGWEVGVTDSERGGARFEFTGIETIE